MNDKRKSQKSESDKYVSKNLQISDLQKTVRFRHIPTTELLKNIHSMTLASLLLTDEKIFTATTPKNVQNDQLYGYPSTKKKDVVTKPLCIQLMFQLPTATVGE